MPNSLGPLKSAAAPLYPSPENQSFFNPLVYHPLRPAKVLNAYPSSLSREIHTQIVLVNRITCNIENARLSITLVFRTRY